MYQSIWYVYNLNCYFGLILIVSVTRFKVKQRGIIGIVVQTSWFEPISDSIADREAAERAQSFYSNWYVLLWLRWSKIHIDIYIYICNWNTIFSFIYIYTLHATIYIRILDPIIYGKYPKEMVNVLGSALPRFSRKEVENLKQLRLDFIGINHYTSYFIQDCLFTTCNAGDGASKAQGFALKLDRKGSVSIGELVSTILNHFFNFVLWNFLQFLFIVIDGCKLAAHSSWRVPKDIELPKK